jgi:hypothetical protein
MIEEFFILFHQNCSNLSEQDKLNRIIIIQNFIEIFKTKDEQTLQKYFDKILINSEDVSFLIDNQYENILLVLNLYKDIFTIKKENLEQCIQKFNNSINNPDQFKFILNEHIISYCKKCNDTNINLLLANLNNI